MDPANSKKPPRFAFQGTPKLERRLKKRLELERADRPFLTLSDLLRDLIDQGLRTLESPGTSERDS